MIVTLIGERQAKEASEFIYLGPLTTCRECRLKSVCFNLEEGKRYVVRKVRENKHECKIHDEGVRVVEVEPIPFRIAVHGSSAIEGSLIALELPNCNDVSCEEYRLCHPPALRDGMKARIVKVDRDLACHHGYSLKEVVIE